MVLALALVLGDMVLITFLLDVPPTVSKHGRQMFSFENLYSPSKHGRTINSTNQDTNTNQNKTKNSDRADRKHLKLNSNLDTRLAHNTLGKAKPKYS